MAYYQQITRGDIVRFGYFFAELKIVLNKTMEMELKGINMAAIRGVK